MKPLRSRTARSTALDEVKVEGDPGAGDVTIRYLRAGRVLAVATMGRDLESLEAEVALGAAGGAR